MVFVGGIIWTASSTCLILSVVAVVLAAALASARKVPPSKRAWALAGIALPASTIAFYITSHSDELYGMVGRDSTLTGRTSVWPVVRALIATRPWLGQGWGAVWGNASLNEEINKSVGFDVSHAHNGYLNVQVQVGGIGLALLLLVLSLVAIRGVADYLKTDSPSSSWALIITVILVIYNKVETSLSEPSTLFLLFATLVVLGKPSTPDVPAVQRAVDFVSDRPRA
jgi:O-antigen ligase